MDIRRLEEKDLQEALDLVWQVFSQFEAPEYGEEGIKTFWDFIQIDPMLQRLRNGDILFYGCCENSTLVGVLAAKSGHISLFFVKSDCHGRGIGRALFHKHLQSAVEKGIRSITVNSSPFAVPIYKKLGFAKTSEEQTINGIRFTPMAYSV